jgi:hypothetical protein
MLMSAPKLSIDLRPDSTDVDDGARAKVGAVGMVR